MKLGAFGHLGLAELDSVLEPRFVSFLTSHERAKIANLKRLREVLIVVQCLETLGFEVRELEVETLGAGEAVPVSFGNSLGDQALIGSVHGKCDETVHEGGLALHAWARRLGGHIAAINSRVAREHAESGGVA